MITWMQQPDGMVIIQVSQDSIEEFRLWINDEYSDWDHPDVQSMYELSDFLKSAVRGPS